MRDRIETALLDGTLAVRLGWMESLSILQRLFVEGCWLPLPLRCRLHNMDRSSSIRSLFTPWRNTVLYEAATSPAIFTHTPFVSIFYFAISLIPQREKSLVVVL